MWHTHKHIYYINIIANITFANAFQCNKKLKRYLSDAGGEDCFEDLWYFLLHPCVVLQYRDEHRMVLLQFPLGVQQELRLPWYVQLQLLHVTGLGDDLVDEWIQVHIQLSRVWMTNNRRHLKSC